MFAVYEHILHSLWIHIVFVSGLMDVYFFVAGPMDTYCLVSGLMNEYFLVAGPDAHCISYRCRSNG